jgi:hypothetical protein
VIYPLQNIDDMVDMFLTHQDEDINTFQRCQSAMNRAMRRGWVQQVEEGQKLHNLKWARRQFAKGYRWVKIA